jgi:mannose-6-phosphate isomerase
MLASLIPLLPNRVRRNYRGGYLLENLEGNILSPRDGDRPEDWLASTVPAINPGLPPIADEGLSRVHTPTGETMKLSELFRKEPAYYLGAQHAQRPGGGLGFLAKLLDSSMRLHVQAHPTAAFARRYLNSPFGKLETYVILALRDERNGYIRLGFQRPPSPREWKRIVLEQDIPAMDACFDRIPVRVGEVWLVPGGLPHAIGAGVLMLEVMEPSDLVVRCEFVREGVIVPPSARFMQSPVDLALQIFDYTPMSVAQVEETYKISPQRFNSCEELLIGPEQTDCFSVTRLTIDRIVKLSSPGHPRIGIVAGGRGTLTVANQSLSLKQGSRFLLAASAPRGELVKSGEESLQVLFCSPGQAS